VKKTTDLTLHYTAADGPQTLECSVPSSLDIRFFGPSWPGNPLNPEDLNEILTLPFDIDRETLVIVNDLDRPTPTNRILSALADSHPDILSCDVLVAAGAHRLSGDSDVIKRAILGNIVSSHTGGFHVHNCWDDPMMRVGVTSRGTEVAVSGWLFSYRRIAAVGSVEPHWFAGYTGGRKSLIPGISAYETIRQNHSMASHPDARHMKTEGNPLHEDLNEATALVVNAHRKEGGESIVGINVVSHNDDLFALTVAPILDSIDPLRNIVDATYSVQADRADIVIALAESPMDRDLYQAMKSFENVRSVLNPGGVYLLIAQAPDGVGPPHFSRTLSLGCETDELETHLAGSYVLGNHKFINPLKFIRTDGLLLVCSETLASLPDGPTALGFFQAEPSFAHAVDTALSHVRTNNIRAPRVAVVQDAVNTVLIP